MPENEKNSQAVDEVETIPEEDSGLDQAAAKIKKLREELEKCNEERREYLDGWQRARAELINYKKDEVKRFDQFAKLASEGVIADAVAVLDSFDLALQHEMPKDLEKGVILIRSQLEDVLRRRGLEAIHSKGRKFDPSFHEAVGETEGQGEEDVVTEELQKGYLLNGMVLRPAKVKISKKK